MSPETGLRIERALDRIKSALGICEHNWAFVAVNRREATGRFVYLYRCVRCKCTRHEESIP